MSEEPRKVQYGPALLERAEEWELYPSTLTDGEGNTWAVERCATCHNAIIHDPGTSAGVAFHLISVHGYRMDGRHEEEQAAAAEAAAERGEMNAVHRP